MIIIEKPLSLKRARELAARMKFGDTAWTTRKADCRMMMKDGPRFTWCDAKREGVWLPDYPHSMNTPILPWL